jgi:hypothetical protein
MLDEILVEKLGPEQSFPCIAGSFDGALVASQFLASHDAGTLSVFFTGG